MSLLLITLAKNQHDLYIPNTIANLIIDYRNQLLYLENQDKDKIRKNRKKNLREMIFLTRGIRRQEDSLNIQKVYIPSYEHYFTAFRICSKCGDYTSYGELPYRDITKWFNEVECSCTKKKTSMVYKDLMETWIKKKSKNNDDRVWGHWVHIHLG